MPSDSCALSIASCLTIKKEREQLQGYLVFHVLLNIEGNREIEGNQGTPIPSIPSSLPIALCLKGMEELKEFVVLQILQLLQCYVNGNDVFCQGYLFLQIPQFLQCHRVLHR